MEAQPFWVAANAASTFPLSFYEDCSFREHCCALWKGKITYGTWDVGYSYLSNKRSPTIILFGKMFQALRSYKDPTFIFFLKKVIEKMAIFKNLFM